MILQTWQKQSTKLARLAAICLMLTICLSKCSAWSVEPRPLVKNWFLDSRDERALVRKKCDGDKCVIVEKLSYEEADSYFCRSSQDHEREQNYIKALERAIKNP